MRSQSLYAGLMCTLIVLMLIPNLSDAGLDESIVSGGVELARGDRKETIEAFDMFDKFAPAKNFTIPPLGD